MGVDAQMLVITKQIYTPKELRKISSKLTDCFGPDYFWLNEDGDQHALEFVEEYEQDGDSIFPKHGQSFINVNLSGRYYGPGYERGNIIVYINIAEWLEIMIPDARIFYGGDSSGICAEPFDKNARREMFEYFAAYGHKPYQSGFGFMNGKEPICHFCADTPMNNVGWGGGDNFYSCGSCGKQIIKFADGTIKQLKDGEDFFDAHRSGK